MSTSIAIHLSTLNCPSSMSSESDTASINSSTSSQSKTASYEEQRRQFMQQLYDDHNGHQQDISSSSSSSYSKQTKMHKTDQTDQFENEQKSLIYPSCTTHAASDSFIRDSHSPLFSGIDKKDPNHVHFFHKLPLSTSTKTKKLFKTHRPQKSCNDVEMPKKYIQDSRFKRSQSVDDWNQNESLPDVPNLESIEELQKTKIMNNPILKKRKTNIYQNEDIKAPIKMKKKASEEELQMVLDHFQEAHDKDIEQILVEHEPHVIRYRDAKYAEAKQLGITLDSDDKERLKILGDVVKFTYMNIEPPNEYTKVCTDF